MIRDEKIAKARIEKMERILEELADLSKRLESENPSTSEYLDAAHAELSGAIRYYSDELQFFIEEGGPTLAPGEEPRTVEEILAEQHGNLRGNK